jgi:exodeoxyribonuclease VII large subunit
VQGEGAAAYLSSGIRYFNRMKDDPIQGVDVIVIGRGGGSMEDLWAFNDETLARTVAASDLPVISAVGHEVDYTICDFVADVRAATPSAALEIALPDKEELKKHLFQQSRRLTASMAYGLRQRRERLAQIGDARVLRSPMAPYTERRLTLDRLSQALDAAVTRRLEWNRQSIRQAAGQLHALSPLGVLNRGYALVQTHDGAVVHSTQDVTVGQSLTMRLSDGHVGVTVTDVAQNEKGDSTNG